MKGCVSLAEECRQKAKKVYEDHYAKIRRITPKERLLDFQLQEGWEPLCRILEKEVPDVPFPKINEGPMFRKQLELMYQKALMRSIWNFGAVCFVLIVGVVLQLCLFG